jgi:hypothetical protein
MLTDFRASTDVHVHEFQSELMTREQAEMHASRFSEWLAST